MKAAFGATLAALACHAGAAAAPSNAARAEEYRLEVISRLAGVSALLDSRSEHAAALAKEVRDLSATSTAGVLRHAISEGDAIARDLAKSQVIMQELELSEPSGSAEFRQVAAQQADAEAAKAAEYASSVKSLISKVSAAPPADVQRVLEEAKLPATIAIVIDPVQSGSNLPPNASQSGDSSAYHLILSGAATVDYPAVAAILSRDPGGGLSTSCTGTLIAPNAVLTAAHCVSGAFPVEVYFQHAGIFKIAASVPSPDFPNPPPDIYPTAGDVAVIFLSNDVTGIAPIELNEATDVPPGTTGVIVGYGWHSGPTLPDAAGTLNGLVAKAGIKLFANTTTSVCPANALGKRLICWLYQSGPLEALQGSTCFGDSGGPFAVFDGGSWKLAGVTSAASTCRPGDRAYDTDIYPYVGWIKSVLASRPAGALAFALHALQPMTNDPSVYKIDASDRTFEPSQASWSKQFLVDPSVKTLRIAINSTPSSDALHLSAGPDTGVSSCTESSDDTVLFCGVSPATAGVWTVSVQGHANQEFQLVATEFGS